MNQHQIDLERYCQSVVSGERPACKWERLAVERHLRDLYRQGTDAFPYVFDLERAERIVKFAECFPHVKGKWASRVGRANRLKLEPWQKFILMVIFGWVHQVTRLRMFRIAYVCVPRKNGKSVIAAVIGLYMLVEDGEWGAEVYCGATSEKQAWEVFRPAKRMVEKKSAFRLQ